MKRLLAAVLGTAMIGLGSASPANATGRHHEVRFATVLPIDAFAFELHVQEEDGAPRGVPFDTRPSASGPCRRRRGRRGRSELR